MESQPVIDPATIENLRTLNTDDNDDFLKEIVSLFEADVPARFAELEQGLAEGNRAKFARAAHSLKGSAANLGAGHLKAAAERLEARVHASGLDGVGPLVAALKLEAERAQAALRVILASPPKV